MGWIPGQFTEESRVLELVFVCWWVGLGPRGIPGLMLACWWMEAGPEVSGYRALGVLLELVSTH